LQVRSLIKDISKLYDIPFQEVNQITGEMLNEAIPAAKKEHGITAGVYNPTWEELKKYSPTLSAYLHKYPHIATHIENLQGQIRSISRHAGGILFAENLDKHMPLINSGGVVQTPWTEGQTVRHLEPLGFIKFDVLGLASLRMLENCIESILKNHCGIKAPAFSDIKKFYDEKLHPEKIDLNDQEVYKNVFQAGKFAGTFQFTNINAQKFCSNIKPKNIIDIAAITSIYRPGPLSANVDKKYLEAKNNPEKVEYIHPLIKEVTENTYGFIIFQEQLSMLAHKLGNNISLDEGNELRKVLTKKGTGKEAQVKEKLYGKFISGCIDKGITQKQADDLWKTMEFFSGYGFNAAHATGYAILSYQCAWLLNYYPSEWLCAFLEKEPEDRKESAISIAKSFGYSIRKLDINKSGINWEVSSDEPKTLIQPLSSIKGLGEAAIGEIMKYRPFSKIEDLLFHDKMIYSKVNKKSLDSLTRGGALNNMVDSRFTGLKHFWSACVVDRPKTKKKFEENIPKYAPEGDFSVEEKIEHTVSLIGSYPVNDVVEATLLTKLEQKGILPISEFVKDETQFVWFIPRKIENKKTKNGKAYQVATVTDSTGTLIDIKCWGDPKRESFLLNRAYMGKLNHEGSWGFSVRSFKEQIKLLG
jgi:DNA polymerase-3 subunit alpha